MCFLKNPKYKLRPVLVALQVRHGAALHRAGGFGAAACGRILHASLSLSPPLSLSLPLNHFALCRSTCSR
jgi:hypothetical protein